MVTLKEIDERLQQLPPEKLTVVYEFVSFLLEHSERQDVSTLQTMLPSENLLKQDWDRPEEDEAWAHL